MPLFSLMSLCNFSDCIFFFFFGLPPNQSVVLVSYNKTKFTETRKDLHRNGQVVLCCLFQQHQPKKNRVSEHDQEPDMSQFISVGNWKKGESGHDMEDCHVAQLVRDFQRTSGR